MPCSVCCIGHVVVFVVASRKVRSSSRQKILNVGIESSFCSEWDCTSPVGTGIYLESASGRAAFI